MHTTVHVPPQHGWLYLDCRVRLAMSLSLYTAATVCGTKERQSSVWVGHFKLQSSESRKVSFPGSCRGCTTAWNETRVWLAGPLPGQKSLSIFHPHLVYQGRATLTLLEGESPSWKVSHPPGRRVTLLEGERGSSLIDYTVPTPPLLDTSTLWETKILSSREKYRCS